MESFLLLPDAKFDQDLQITGLFLSADRYPSIRLFARLAVVVQNGAAHKELWGCRDGTSICMKCLTLEASSELSEIDPSLKTNVLKVDQLEKKQVMLHAKTQPGGYHGGLQEKTQLHY